jgi:ankyrin repeat protein
METSIPETDQQRNASTMARFLDAALDGNEAVIKQLLPRLDANVVCHEGRSAAHRAAQNGHWKLLEVLERGGANLNLADEKGVTPIQLAVFHDHRQAVIRLKALGANLGCRTPDGGTLMTLAAQQDHAELIELLFSNQVSLNEKNTDGWTPLHVAVSHKCDQAVTRLIELGADVNAAGRHGFTPLHTAVNRGLVEMIDLLVARGADLNQQDTHGLAPIHAAAKRGQAEALARLIGHGVSPDARTRYADTPAFFATAFQRPNVIEALIRHGADLNLANDEGWAPVHAATTPGNEAVLKILLDWGVDAGAIGERRITAAHAAAISGNAAAIDLLREAGAMLNMENAAGKTPLQVARALDKAAAVAALEKMPPDGPRMEAAVQALVTSSDTETSNLGVDLRCPVLYTAYNQTGGSRPVRLPSGTVLSAIAARSCLTRTDGLAGDPMNGSQFDRATVQAFLASDAFKRGDPMRLSMVQAAYLAYAKPGMDAQSTSGSADEAASPRQQADLPEFQAILNRMQTPGNRNADRGPCCAVM